MTNIFYQVIQEFNPEKQYPVHIRNQIANCLSLMKKNEQFRTYDFARKHQGKLSPKNKFDTAKFVVIHSLRVARKIGMIKQVNPNPNQLPFEEFCKLETVQNLKSQLRGSRYKHKESDGNRSLSGTQLSYLHHLYHFNNWLQNKEFSCNVTTQTGQNTFEIKRETIVLQNVEQLLKLYQKTTQNDIDFVRIIKQYLMDDFHKGKKPSSIDKPYYAILAYFNKNDYPIEFNWNSKIVWGDAFDEEKNEKTLTLVDLLEMLTTGKPSVTEKAVVLCKFHRGLDNSTLTDRFNYEAWNQLVDWFGTIEYNNWDMKKCPVPIVLTRVKTSYKHRGFLDVDAIKSLQKYLDYRQEKTGKPMKDGEPLFITTKNEPINNQWISGLIPKLAKRSQIQKVLEHYSRVIRYEKTSHELRDLLKSTLIVSGTVGYVCELAIGHKVGDSYEKQDLLYPEKSRAEFAKASKKINVFSNITNYIKNDFEKDGLKQEIADLKQILEKEKNVSQSDIDKLKEDNKKILQWIERQQMIDSKKSQNIGVF